MKSITIRGIDEQLEKKLGKKAKEEHQSLNRTILSLLRKALGIVEKAPYATYDDLDHLAGTWTKDDESEFNEAVSGFDSIESDIWK
ncbi:MAG: hypothetical protein JW881_22160 [Spirochaetales bacterium]|nr:hypothetical protein [Spirochaetales bacterium]